MAEVPTIVDHLRGCHSTQWDGRSWPRSQATATGAAYRTAPAALLNRELLAAFPQSLE